MSYHASVAILIVNASIWQRSGSRHDRIGVVAISSREWHGQRSDNSESGSA